MASRSSYNKSKTRFRGENNELIPVRSGIFYGIQTEKIKTEKNTVNKNITATPNIIFYDNYTKAMIDFSDYQNKEESSDVSSFFALLQIGYSFTVSNAKWKNTNLNSATYDIGGTFSFSKIVDKVIFADVTTINSYNQKITRYDKEYFINFPTIEFVTIVEPVEKIVKSIIYNHLGKNTKNSFAYIGAYIGDYVKLQNQDIKYKIDSIEIDKDGKETITIIGDINEENNIGTPILVNLYQNNNNKILLTYDNTALGKCEILSDTSVIACLDNQTELQAKLRENKSQKITTNFIIGQYCTFTDEQTQFTKIRRSNGQATILQQSKLTPIIPTNTFINTLFTS